MRQLYNPFHRRGRREGGGDFYRATLLRRVVMAQNLDHMRRLGAGGAGACPPRWPRPCPPARAPIDALERPAHRAPAELAAERRILTAALNSWKQPRCRAPSPWNSRPLLGGAHVKLVVRRTTVRRPVRWRPDQSGPRGRPALLSPVRMQQVLVGGNSLAGPRRS